MDDKALAQLIKSMATTMAELETALDEANARLLSRQMRHSQCIDMLQELQSDLREVIRDYEAKTGQKWVK